MSSCLLLEVEEHVFYVDPVIIDTSFFSPFVLNQQVDSYQICMNTSLGQEKELIRLGLL